MPLLLIELFVWILLFLIILFVASRLLKAFFPNRAIFKSGKKTTQEEDEEEEEEEEEDEDDVEAMEGKNQKVNGQAQCRADRLSSGSTPLTSLDTVDSPNGGAAVVQLTSAGSPEWEPRTTRATRLTPRQSPSLGNRRRASQDVVQRPVSVENRGGVAEKLRRWSRRAVASIDRRKSLESAAILVTTLLMAYALTLGVLALIYYLQEDAVLYGEAVVCPADAAGQCQKNDVDVPCCDYTLDEGLRHSERFLGVAAPVGAASPSDAPARYLARIHTWLVEADSGGEFYSTDRPKYLIYTHGNIDNLSFDKTLYAWIARDLGINVLAWDYPGFGKSTGKPAERTIYLAVETIFRFLVEEKGARRGDIVLWGYSLGGAVTVHAANKFPGVMGVILQAPIDSAMQTVAASLPLTGWACPNAITQQFNTAEAIKSLRTCLFVFVGAEDGNFSPARMRTLFNSAQRSNPTCRTFVEIPGQGHFSNPLDSSHLIKQLRFFLNKIINMTN